MGSIRAVFLDVGWTLAYPRASMWEIFAELCTVAGVPTTPESCEQLVRGLWRAGQEHAERQFREGARYSDSDEEFAQLFFQLGGVIFSQMGVVDGHEERTQHFLKTFWNEANWVAFPEVTEVLTALRARNIKLGVLSNAPSDLPKLLERLGVAPYLDFSVVSAIEGVKKPDRRIFEAALLRADVAPHEALHIGDMYLEDVVGGRAAGVNTLLMERGDRSLFPNFRESEGREVEAPLIITNLSQLLDRLDTRVPGP